MSWADTAQPTSKLLKVQAVLRSQRLVSESQSGAELACLAAQQWHDSSRSAMSKPCGE